MATPLGGGQAVVTFGLLNKYLGHDTYFIDWTMRMVPISLLIIAAIGLLMYFMPTDRETFGRSKEFYRQELDKIGPMTFEEKVSFFAFVIAIGLAILQPLYASYTKGPMWGWLNPTHLFCIIPLILLFVPSKQVKGESILSTEALRKYFPITILFMWPTSIALSKILGATGAGAVFSQWIAPLLTVNDTLSLFAWSVFPNLLSQVTSDTAAAGVMVPLAIEAMGDWHGLEFGAVAWIWVTGSAISWAYAVASATGAQGIVAGYGANLRTMFVWGMIACVISILLTFLFFYVTVLLLELDFYVMPPM